MVAQAVETTKEDCQVLDTILALVVSSVLPSTQPLPQAPPGPWQPPKAQHQAPHWAWNKV